MLCSGSGSFQSSGSPGSLFLAEHEDTSFGRVSAIVSLVLGEDTSVRFHTSTWRMEMKVQRRSPLTFPKCAHS